MVDAAVLTLIDGVRVCVPDSLDLITPYVLREQQDYFEHELRFIRRLLQPGQKVIDIGANYGVYTLPMARKVGPRGHVWAFEPASSTAQFLAQGIAANAFGNVTLERSAVSSAPGQALFSLQAQAELNSIIHGQAPAGDSETVCVVTLDQCMDRFRWTEIDLLKIDAEGEENSIVKGGHRFFAELSPLVQYELRKDADSMNFALIREFAALGYDSYRLIPGLDILVPFDFSSPPDPYLLNLFCCKADRAAWLAARGALLCASEVPRPIEPEGTVDGRDAPDTLHHWRNALAQLPYAASLISAWEGTEAAGTGDAVIRALLGYARSRDTALPLAERFEALESSFLVLRTECQRDASRLRLASLARIAQDYGERAVSVNALKQLLARIRDAGVDPSEPFLPPLERFDSIALDEEPGRWLVAAALEASEKLERFSSFYAGAIALERLEDIRELGLGSTEMQRRLELVRQRIEQARRPRIP